MSEIFVKLNFFFLILTPEVWKSPAGLGWAWEQADYAGSPKWNMPILLLFLFLWIPRNALQLMWRPPGVWRQRSKGELAGEVRFEGPSRVRPTECETGGRGLPMPRTTRHDWPVQERRREEGSRGARAAREPTEPPGWWSGRVHDRGPGVRGPAPAQLFRLSARNASGNRQTRAWVR